MKNLTIRTSELTELSNTELNKVNGGTDNMIVDGCCKLPDIFTLPDSFPFNK